MAGGGFGLWIAATDVGVGAGEPDLGYVLLDTLLAQCFGPVRVVYVYHLAPEVVAIEGSAFVDANGVAADLNDGILGPIEEADGSIDPADGGDCIPNAHEADGDHTGEGLGKGVMEGVCCR